MMGEILGGCGEMLVGCWTELAITGGVYGREGIKNRMGVTLVPIVVTTLSGMFVGRVVERHRELPTRTTSIGISPAPANPR